MASLENHAKTRMQTRPRRSSPRSQAGRLSKALAASLAVLVPGSQLVWTASAHADAGDGATANFPDANPSATTALTEGTAANALKVRTAPVSATGAFMHSLPFSLPPARMTPSLGLAYISDGFRTESPVGTGWSFGPPSIRRSTRAGFPALLRDDDGVRYSAAGPFEGPAGPLTTATEDVPVPDGSGQFFVPVREYEPVRYEFVEAEDRWVEHLPSGAKRFYGRAPSGEARVRNELGTAEWLLIEERDFDGNIAEYDYHYVQHSQLGQNRSDLHGAQAVPILRTIRYGGSLADGSPVHPFRVSVNVRPYEGALNMLQGHTVLAALVSSIDVYGPTHDTGEGQERYWRYALDIASSETGRPLLRSVTFSAPDVAPVVHRFEYSENERAIGSVDPTNVAQCDAARVDSWGPPQPLSPELASVFRIGDGRDLDTATVLRELERNEPYEGMSPRYSYSGYQWMDFDADGDTDVIHHPTGQHAPVSQLLVSQSHLKRGDRFEAVAGQGAHAALGIQADQLISTFADVDGDRDQDAVSFPLFMNDPLSASLSRDTALYHVPDGDPSRFDTDTKRMLLERMFRARREGIGMGAGCQPTGADIQLLSALGMPHPEGPEPIVVPPFIRLPNTGLDPRYRPSACMPILWFGSFCEAGASIQDGGPPECPAGESGLGATRTAGAHDIRVLISRNSARGEERETYARIEGWPDGVSQQAMAEFDGSSFSWNTRPTNCASARVCDPLRWDQVVHEDGTDAEIEELWSVLYPPLPNGATPGWRAKVTQLSDFLAPMADLTGSGKADIVLLKDLDGRAIAGTPRYEFIPRVFLGDGEGFELDGTPPNRPLELPPGLVGLAPLLTSDSQEGAAARGYVERVRPLVAELSPASTHVPPALADALPAEAVFALEEEVAAARSRALADSLSPSADQFRKRVLRIADRAVLGTAVTTQEDESAVSKLAGSRTILGDLGGRLGTGLVQPPRTPDLRRILDMPLADPAPAVPSPIDPSLFDWNRVDWPKLIDIFTPRDAPAAREASDFTNSIVDILAGGVSYGCVSNDMATCDSESAYPVSVNFNSMVVDVNGDGLPDLVTAHRPPRIERGEGQLPLRECIPGHKVHLNRGYRWDTYGEQAAQTTVDEHWSTRALEAHAPAGSDAALLRLRNRSASCGTVAPLLDKEEALLGRDYRTMPTATNSFVDLDLDGRSDLIMAGEVLQGTVFGTESRVDEQYVYLNRNRGYERASGTTNQAGRDIGTSCDLPANLTIASFKESIVLPPVADEPGAEVTTRAVQVVDQGPRARFVDVDDDGAPDLVTRGECFKRNISVGRNRVVVRRACDPATWRKNLREVPDLLTRVEESSGTWTDVEYIAATSDAARAQAHVKTPGELSPGQMVVAKIHRGAAPGHGEWAPLGTGAVERIDFTYDRFVREEGGSSAVGFETVTATYYDGTGCDWGDDESFACAWADPVLERVTYDTRPSVDGSSVKHPLRGAVRERRSLHPGTRTEMVVSVGYEVASMGNGVRVRTASTYSAQCVDNVCVQSGREVQDRDALGYESSVLSGVANSSGVLGEADSILEETGYFHQAGEWRIGLPNQSKVYGYRESIDGAATPRALLSQSSAIYVSGRLDHRVAQVVAQDTCGERTVSTTHYRYNRYGLVVEVTDNAERVLRVVYGPHQLYPQSQWLEVSGSTTSVELRERFEYDYRFGVVRFYQDFNGSEWGHDFDARGRETLVRGPGGVELKRAHYHDGDRTPAYAETWSYTEPSSAFGVRSYFDGTGARVAEIEYTPARNGAPERYVRTYRAEYDSRGRVRQSAVPRHVSSFADVRIDEGEPLFSLSYDGFDRVLTSEKPDGTMTRRQFAVRDGRLQMDETNARGFVTTHEYDWRGDLVRLERRDQGGEAAAVYDVVRDGLGQPVRIIDADGLIRRMEYDLGGRVRYATLPHQEGSAGTPFSYCHNVDGDLVHVSTPAGREVDIERDLLGREKSVTAINADETLVTTFGYDDPSEGGLGRMTSVTDESGSWSFGYDIFGHRTSSKLELSPELISRLPSGAPHSFKVHQEYGLAGQLLATTYVGESFESRLDYRHDARGRVVGLTSTDAIDERALVKDVVYDEMGRMTTTTLGNDVKLGRTHDGRSGFTTSVFVAGRSGTLAEARYPLGHYDAHGNPWLEQRYGPGGTLLSEKRHTFDGQDRLTSTKVRLGDTGPSWLETFRYSPAGNLLDAADEAYEYGDASNAQAATRVGARELEYDADGFLIRQYDEGGNEDRDLSYDARGCLRTTTSTGAEGTRKSSHLCGLGGRRVFRETSTGDGESDSVLYLPGNAEVRAHEDLLVISMPIGRVSTAEMAWSLSSGDWIEEESGFIHTDLRGSVLAKTAFDGEPENADELAEYGPWGETYAVGNASVSRHQFTAREPDPGDGYYHFGARVYDPSLRRWLSPDPLLLTVPELDAADGTQLNLYAYVGNNPVVRTDHSGTWFESAVDLASIGAGIASIASWDEDTSTLDKALDVGGLVVDAGALVLPGVPGVAGLSIKASRGAGRVADAAQAANRTQDAVQVAERGRRAAGRGARSADEAAESARTGRRTSSDGTCSGSRCGEPSGTCFVAGTEVRTHRGLTAIEKVAIGDRVRTHGEENCSAPQPREGWRVVRLEVPNPDGTADTIVVSLARSESWIREHDAWPGNTIPFSLPELSIDGAAVVTSHQPMPEVADGIGCVVTGTLTHRNGFIHAMFLRGRSEPIEATDVHRFYSLDREEWVELSALSAGERLRTRSGALAVAEVRRRSSVQQVFNIEVEGEHTYFVTDDDVWAHNPTGPGCGDEASDGSGSRGRVDVSSSGVREGTGVNQGRTATTSHVQDGARAAEAASTPAQRAASRAGELLHQAKRSGVGAQAGRSGGHGTPYLRAGAQLQREAAALPKSDPLRGALRRQADRLIERGRSINHPGRR